MVCRVVLCYAGKTTTIRALADLLPQVPVVAKDPFNSGGVEWASAAGITSGVVLGGVGAVSEAMAHSRVDVLGRGGAVLSAKG